jgi:hypothetical protein
MALQAKLWSLNALATETGTNIRTLGRTLDGVPPDGKLGKHPAWYLKTALRALARRDAATSNQTPNAACDRIERIWGELEPALETARAEPDLEKRRAMIGDFGYLVGELDRAMETAAAGSHPDQAPLLNIVRENTIGQLIAEVLEIGYWRLPDSLVAPA